jgi:hypothetical protein
MTATCDGFKIDASAVLWFARSICAFQASSGEDTRVMKNREMAPGPVGQINFVLSEVMSSPSRKNIILPFYRKI